MPALFTRIEVICAEGDALRTLGFEVPTGPGLWYVVRGLRDDGVSIQLSAVAAALEDLRHAWEALALPAEASALQKEIASRLTLAQRRPRQRRDTVDRVGVIFAVGGALASLGSFTLDVFRTVAAAGRTPAGSGPDISESQTRGLDRGQPSIAAHDMHVEWDWTPPRWSLPQGWAHCLRLRNTTGISMLISRPRFGEAAAIPGRVAFDPSWEIVPGQWAFFAVEPFQRGVLADRRFRRTVVWLLFLISPSQAKQGVEYWEGYAAVPHGYEFRGSSELLWRPPGFLGGPSGPETLALFRRRGAADD